MADDRFVGSLFWLEPGTVYDVRVTFADPNGDPLDGAILLDSGSTRVELSVPPAIRSSHASPSGSGKGCSPALPCALAGALDQVESGEEVVLRDGVYYTSDVSIPRSGTEAAPIVIRGADGEAAIMDGADPADLVWRDVSSGIYHTTASVADTFLVLPDGERLLPYRTMGDLQALSWGIPGFYEDGTDLYVHLARDADPNHAEMVVSRFANAFLLNRDHVVFQI